MYPWWTSYTKGRATNILKQLLRRTRDTGPSRKLSLPQAGGLGEGHKKDIRTYSKPRDRLYLGTRRSEQGTPA